jgi:hypothetical protein
MTDQVGHGTEGDHLVRDFPLRAGVLTSIGSLPHDDVDEAIAFELGQHPKLPAMPTLPALRPLEGMVAQAGWGVDGVTVRSDGSLDVDAAQLDPVAPTSDPDLEGEPFASWRAFFDAVADRSGPIKLQLTGPVTFGLALLHAGAPAPLAFATAATAVADRTRALLALAERRAPEAARIIFFDEPGLVGGLRNEIPLSPDDQIDLLSGVMAVAEHRAIPGVHCCGPADWRVVLNAGPRILSLPVGAGAVRVAGSLAEFLDRGGWVAWGAVPTAAPIGERPSRYWKLLSSQWCDLVQGGCDPMRLRRQALITPECGLASHDVAQARHVLDLCRDVSQRLHDQALGVRLSVGA